MVSPEQLDFGEVQTRERPIRTLTMRNAGEGRLFVKALILSKYSDFYLRAPPEQPPLWLEPGAAMTLEVGLVPPIEYSFYLTSLCA